jgi:hypothetical protein
MMNRLLSQPELLFIIKLLAAHFIADYLIQPKSWVKDKKTNREISPFLYLHGFIVAILSYLFLGKWGSFMVPLIIFVSHTAIDLWKSYQRNNLRTYLFDQTLHVSIILLLWLILWHDFSGIVNLLSLLLHNYKLWVYIFAYAFVVWPATSFVSKLSAKWRDELDQQNNLKGAEKIIGLLERLLVLTFMLFSQYNAIGYLLIAESVFRFIELKEKDSSKTAEYIIIVTLLSYSLAIASGLMVKLFLQFQLI